MKISTSIVIAFWIIWGMFHLAYPWFDNGVNAAWKGYNSWVERQFPERLVRGNQHCRNWSYICSQEYEECKR